MGCPCPHPRFSYTLAELFAVMGAQGADTNNVCTFNWTIDCPCKNVTNLSLPVLWSYEEPTLFPTVVQLRVHPERHSLEVWILDINAPIGMRLFSRSLGSPLLGSWRSNFLLLHWAAVFWFWCCRRCRVCFSITAWWFQLCNWRVFFLYGSVCTS